MFIVVLIIIILVFLLLSLFVLFCFVLLVIISSGRRRGRKTHSNSSNGNNDNPELESAVSRFYKVHTGTSSMAFSGVGKGFTEIPVGTSALAITEFLLTNLI